MDGSDCSLCGAPIGPGEGGYRDIGDGHWIDAHSDAKFCHPRRFARLPVDAIVAAFTRAARAEDN